MMHLINSGPEEVIGLSDESLMECIEGVFILKKEGYIESGKGLKLREVYESMERRYQSHIGIHAAVNAVCEEAAKRWYKIMRRKNHEQ